jgi:hypothetical protein
MLRTGDFTSLRLSFAWVMSEIEIYRDSTLLGAF